MKHLKVCPKCGSSEILNIVQGGPGSNGYGNFVWTGVFKKAALITRYICCDCGYTEEYVNKADIERIRDHYNK